MTEIEQSLADALATRKPHRTDDDVMAELERHAKSADNPFKQRPTVHTLQAQQEEGERYAVREAAAASVSMQFPTQREVVSATKMREALYALLKKAEEATNHAAVIAASLDGGSATIATPNRIKPTEHNKVPLFNQFAQQVVLISQQVDMIEAQLKRIDAVLA